MSFIVNSFQTPNVYADWIYPVLTEAETKCLVYMCRRIYGFGHADGQGRVSLSQMVGGTYVNGVQKDAGTGLSRNGVLKAIERLQKFGLIRKVEPANFVSQAATLWALETDENMIDMSELLKRKERRQDRNSGKAKNFALPTGGSTDEPIGGSTDEPTGGSTDEPIGGSTDERPPVQQMSRSSYIERKEERQYEENQYEENQLEKNSSSSSSSRADQVNEKIDDDDDLVFKLLKEEFSITKSETIAGTVRGWLDAHPVSHVLQAIRTAATYTPDAPLVYISKMIEPKTTRGISRGYEIPADMQGIVIG